jgi:NAD(P)-dependent dehydrogenase (short-subunit alcohol dehydrogenase family)
MTDIAGGVAVVTGGASGIGRGIAEQLLAEGAQVVIADIEPGALERTAAEIGAHPVVTDVTDPAAVGALAEETLRQFGAVTIVVNNAGVGPMARIRDLTLQDWRWMVDVNLFGVIHGIRTFLPILSDGGRPGHFVNTGSMASFLALPGQAAYGVTKFGIAALTDALSQELAEDAPHVHATLLAPGTVHTNIKESLRNRRDGAPSAALYDVDISTGEAAALRWMQPIEVGRVVTRAIRNNDRFALTHPDWWPMVEEGQHRLRDAFAKYPAE